MSYQTVQRQNVTRLTDSLYDYFVAGRFPARVIRSFLSTNQKLYVWIVAQEAVHVSAA